MKVLGRTLRNMTVTYVGVRERVVEVSGGERASCRDVGGYLTRTGEIIRWRTVLRWDATPGPDLAQVFALADVLERPLALVDVALLDLPAALGTLAAATGPVLLHDSAAGGRVDEVVSVLLGSLGVCDDDIAREHAASVHRGLAYDGEGMRGRLRDIRLRHGSMIGYACDAGVDIAVLDQLRDRLLV